jgi:hypothetical protein
MDAAIQAIGHDALPMPADLPGRLTEAVQGTPQSWDEALSKIVRSIMAARPVG